MIKIPVLFMAYQRFGILASKQTVLLHSQIDCIVVTRHNLFC